MDWIVPIAGWLVLTAVLTVCGIAVWQLIGHARFIQYHRFKGITLPAMSTGAFLRLHAGEVWAWMVLGWWTVWAGLRDGLRVPHQVSGPTVLCVHGFSQNGSNFWGIRRALFAAGRPSQALFMGRLGRPLRGYAGPLTEALTHLDGPVDVVCHSMGGVILRLVLLENPQLADRIRRIVTLGSPHQGTAAPRGFALLPDVRELSRGSDVLATLPMLTPLAPHAQVTAVAALRDFVVYPIDSSLPPSARSVVLTGIGHAGLLVHREPIERVVRILTEPSTETA